MILEKSKYSRTSYREKNINTEYLIKNILFIL